MLRIEREALSLDLVEEMAQLQARVDSGTACDEAWGDFVQTFDTPESMPSKLKERLQAQSHRKCCYCEGSGTVIDHFLPRRSHRAHNLGQGRPDLTFSWENLNWSCSTCNGWACKGAHMRRLQSGRTSLLNPYLAADDPLVHIEFQIEADPGGLPLGYAREREVDETMDAFVRAQETISRFKLNLRSDLLFSRGLVISDFLFLVDLLERNGPGALTPTGHSVVASLAALLACGAHYQAAIRQLLWKEPEGALLRALLEAHIPEQRVALSAWALPPLPPSSVSAVL